VQKSNVEKLLSKNLHMIKRGAFVQAESSQPNDRPPHTINVISAEKKHDSHNALFEIPDGDCFPNDEIVPGRCPSSLISRLCTTECGPKRMYYATF
jgi:hypothetical protein